MNEEANREIILKRLFLSKKESKIPSLQDDANLAIPLITKPKKKVDSSWNVRKTETQKVENIFDEKKCPLLRDAGNKFKPLERLFGTLTEGMAFGESALLNRELADRNRFFNAIALSECLVLRLDTEIYAKHV